MRFVVECNGEFTVHHAKDLRELKKEIPSDYENIYRRIKPPREIELTRIYPANIHVEYGSGRVEDFSITSRIDEHRKDLKALKESGVVTSYEIETYQDRRIKNEAREHAS